MENQAAQPKVYICQFCGKKIENKGFHQFKPEGIYYITRCRSCGGMNTHKTHDKEYKKLTVVRSV